MKKFFKIIITTFITILLISPYFIQNEIAKAAGPTYNFSIAADKANVKPGDTFNLNITVKNTGTTAITNFEVRVPFIKTISDVTYSIESPSFNKILDSNEYASGFNSRSWIENTLSAGETKTYSIKYTVNADPKTPNGLVSSFNLPITWVDPAGAASNSLINVQTFRADIYLNKVYNNSYIANLPKLDSLDNQVSLVALNAKYLASGSKTTNLKTITSANIAAFPNFILETSDVLIEWLAPIDFSAATTATQLASLDNSLVTDWGKVQFTAANLPFLANKPVRITFKNLPFVFESQIKINESASELSKTKATFSQSLKAIIVPEDILTSTSLVPAITVDNPVIETNVENVEIIGKVSDPNTIVNYTIDSGASQQIAGIDLQTGKFIIPVNIKTGSKQVEITTKYKNGETTSKIITVKFVVEATSTETATPTKSSTISLPINQITISLILAAIGLLAIIIGIIFYIVKHRRNKALKQTSINLNPVINKVSTVGYSDENSPESTVLTEKPSDDKKFDLVKLKNKYLNSTDDSKPIVEDKENKD